MKGIFLIIFSLLSLQAMAQSGVIKGQVLERIRNEPIPSSNVIIQDSEIGAVTDLDGKFEITGLKPGLYNLVASFVGFESQVLFEIEVSNARTAMVEFRLKEITRDLDAVSITASPFADLDESPLSVRTIGTNEIKRAPGGNRDISQVVRNLPGVASTVSFRNDIIVRGGSPNENSFYLDGIEVPVINHFQTQGSSGGPVGIFNVDLIREVDFYSGAFPANRGNTLSSIFEFKQKDGRDDKLAFNGILGASDVGVTLEGPVGPNSTFILSARRSYLQFLFSLLELPFLPTYNDMQFKYKHKFNSKNQLTILGIGAIDNFQLNEDAEDTEQNNYILNFLPITEQWNYTVGLKYERFRDNGFSTFVLSHNQLNNRALKYQNNDDSSEDNLIQRYNATESEVKVRVEDYFTAGPWKINLGINYEYAEYNVADFNRAVTQQGVIIRDFSSLIGLNRWGAFGQISRGFIDDRLTLSLGVRADANDFSEDMNNLTEQFSPRFSASYALSNKFSFNFNTGIFYQLPPYTVLGYRDNNTGILENRENGVRYIQSDHVVAGLEYRLPSNARVTLEGFFKKYSNYPFLLEDSISLANLGADFGVIGNAPVTSGSEGRSYGLEFLWQQRLFKGFYGLAAYTWVRSEFTDRNGDFVPSSWDSRHIVSLTGGKKLPANWEIGIRWLFSGGAPFTPFNVAETVRRTNWDVRGFGVPDFRMLNTMRTSAFHQLDLRIDKKYFFERWSLNVFFDIQNAYNFQTRLQDNIDVVRDGNGNPVPNPEMTDFYIPRFVDNLAGTILPTIGIIVEL